MKETTLQLLASSCIIMVLFFILSTLTWMWILRNHNYDGKDKWIIALIASCIGAGLSLLCTTVVLYILCNYSPNQIAI
jgi:hypothetical protein